MSRVLQNFFVLTLGAQWTYTLHMARPTMEEKRRQDARVLIRMREAEKDFLQEAAEKDGRTLSGWLRHTAFSAAEEQLGRDRPAED